MGKFSFGGSHLQTGLTYIKSTSKRKTCNNIIFAAAVKSDVNAMYNRGGVGLVVGRDGGGVRAVGIMLVAGSNQGSVHMDLSRKEGEGSMLPTWGTRNDTLVF